MRNGISVSKKMDFYFTKRHVGKIADELKQYIYSGDLPLRHYRMKEGEFRGGERAGLDLSDWGDFDADADRWGGRDQFFWFRTEFAVPRELAGKTLCFRLLPSVGSTWIDQKGQFLFFRNGELVQGLDANHREAVLTKNAAPEETFDLAVHAYWDRNRGFSEFVSCVSVWNEEVQRLYYNISVPLEAAGRMEQDSKTCVDILGYLDRAINLLDLREPFSGSFWETVREANEFLETEFYGTYCARNRPEAVAFCVGQTHIDVAWLWTVAQTREKVVRSLSTAVGLMEEYPEYTFLFSQPQLYQYLKRDNPELYAKVKEKVREGRWEPEGAMWLESDCNLNSGESLVRQILYGTQFFKREFGVENRILWLPDTFGFSAALPQILKKSGIEYFMTTKISWNEYDKMPYDTFLWQGIDGSEVLTHFVSTQLEGNKKTDYITVYNGRLNPSSLMLGWKRYQQKDLNNEFLVTYGFGDGGGGPTRDMLENARRMEKGIPGCPVVKMGKATEFFDTLKKDVSQNPRLPKWVGELYLEYHRGVYTTMARNKKWNRRCEFLFQSAELFSVLLKLADGKTSYPKEELQECWEKLLLNQFHDILAGSSIREVYEDTDRDYAFLTETGGRLLDAALSGLAARADLKSDSVLVFNQLGFERNDIAEAELPERYRGCVLEDENGVRIPFQTVSEGTGGVRVLFQTDKVPPMGFKAYRLAPGKRTGEENGAERDRLRIENPFFSIRLNERGHIVSLVDRRNGRQVIRPGKEANVLQAFEDKPIIHDAWDINLYYQEKMWEVLDTESIETVEDGPVRRVTRIRKRFQSSEITQDIVTYERIPKIDFRTTVDWKEKHILLKAAFPVEIHSDKAVYDIQFGNIERPTHRNTSWDLARFEVCAQKWADLSEDGYGVGLMNDCKYGYDIRDGVMRLTLLKSPTSPNTDADREIHTFTYSLVPHVGSWKSAGLDRLAYELNCPMESRLEAPHAGALADRYSLFSTDCENAVIETVKQAEDRDGIVVRLYESFNRTTAGARLACGLNVSEVWECDLLENNLERAGLENNVIRFNLKPYEIKTFRIRSAQAPSEGR